MHPEAMDAIRKALASKGPDFQPKTVLEFGSRNINGSPRELFDESVYYFGVDIEDGPGVDLVGNAADVGVSGFVGAFDVVICAEVFEHTHEWKNIVMNSFDHLRQGGLAIFTAASDPRPPHSAVDGHNMEIGEWSSFIEAVNREGQALEYYRNIPPIELRDWLDTVGFHEVLVTTHPRGDVYAKGIK